MNRFIQRYADKIEWVLNGLDRLVFRGTLRSLAYAEGMRKFLWFRGVRLTGFGDYVEAVSDKLEAASLREAQQQGRPVIYLPSSKTKKDAQARAIAKRDGIQEGTVCVLTCVETCKSFEIYRNRQAKTLEIQPRIRKCLFIYHYWIDRVFGWMNARIQTWFPFSIQVCLNGHEWLARQMDRQGLGYKRYENCFFELESPEAAQRLASRQLRMHWPRALQTIARRLNPIHRDLVGDRIDYYWSVYQSEWSSDIRFKDADFLEQHFRSFILHGITSFGSGDVKRYLGGKPHGNFQGEIRSEFKNRAEGFCVRHWVNRNSNKLYDKYLNLLMRNETTVDDASDFKVLRHTEGDPRGTRRWLPMRQGIADLHQRAQVSQKANDRYLDALAATDTSDSLGQLIQGICWPIRRRGRRIRGIRPWSPDDLKLVAAVTRGEFCINGFRNKDLQSLLYETSPATPKERLRRSAHVSRSIRMLRSHGLVRKMPRVRRYHLTPKGREILTAVLTSQRLTLEKINKLTA